MINNLRCYKLSNMPFIHLSLRIHSSFARTPSFGFRSLREMYDWSFVQCFTRINRHYYTKREHFRELCCKESRHANLLRSKTYPDFAANKTMLNDDGTFLLQELEAAREKQQYLKAIETFEEFHRSKPNWLDQWPAQKIAAVVLHIHLKAGLFDALEKLYGEMENSGLKHGEGIYATLIKGRIAKRDWKQALLYLERMKQIGLRNIRIYPHIIKNLLLDGQAKIAFGLFKDMQQYEFNQKTKKQLHDQEMLTLIVNATSLMIRKESEKKENYKNSIEVMLSVFGYMTDRCLQASSSLGDAIFSAMKFHSAEYSVRIINQNRIIDNSLRSQTVMSNLVTNDEVVLDKSSLEEEDLQSFISSVQLAMKDSKKNEEMMKICEFVRMNGPFRVIIDGANVLLAKGTGFKTNLTKLSPKNLLDLCACSEIAHGNGNLAIVIPSSLERRSMFGKSRTYDMLRERYGMELLTVSYIPDDIALLLTCLYNELLLRRDRVSDDFKLITNDSLREHISLVAEQQWRFLTWIRSKQVRFSWNWNDKIILNSDIILKENALEWLLPLEDGRKILISKNQY